MRDPTTEEWTDSILSTDRIFCTTVVTFADAKPLAQKFSDMFSLEAILDPVAGCLAFCGVTPEDFGEIDPSEIIQVNPPSRVVAPTQPNAGSKRMLDLNTHFGKEGEIKVKREASPFSTSSSTNELMRERSGYMSRTPPFGELTTEDSKKRVLDEDAELEKKVAKFQPPTIESQQGPALALPSSVTGIRNTRSATMQRLLPKIVHQSVADRLYPPQDDNTHYVDGFLNDRKSFADERNNVPGGVPANAYASTALKLAALTDFDDKILAITVSSNEENASKGGRMIKGQMYPPTFDDNLRRVRVYVADKTDMVNLQYSLMSASLAKTSFTETIKVYTSNLEPRPHPTTRGEWEEEILFPLMRWRMKTDPNTEQYSRGGGRSGGEGRGGPPGRAARGGYSSGRGQGPNMGGERPGHGHGTPTLPTPPSKHSTSTELKLAIWWYLSIHCLTEYATTQVDPSPRDFRAQTIKSSRGLIKPSGTKVNITFMSIVSWYNCQHSPLWHALKIADDHTPVEIVC